MKISALESLKFLGKAHLNIFCMIYMILFQDLNKTEKVLA
jgi:hypothetical protein